jgi:hypothetical protein
MGQEALPHSNGMLQMRMPPSQWVDVEKVEVRPDQGMKSGAANS